MQVKEAMQPAPVTIDPEESAALAARLLSRHNIGFLPVCSSSGKLLGVVTDRDLVVRCVAAEERAAALPVKRLMSRHPWSVAPEDDLRLAAERMARSQIRRLPVVADGKLVGTVTLGDLARSGACEMEVSRALTAISSEVKNLCFTDR